MKNLLSLIQPSGSITIGNYIGSIKNCIKYQKQYKCFFGIADLHSLTQNIDSAKLLQNKYELFAMLVACGIDETLIFAQSDIPQHAELAWILTCNTYMGELSRMIQFKEKSKKQNNNINAGLFSYPILMAADILLYQTDFVPIGEDQKQHLELAKTIAVRFNNKYSTNIFHIPTGIFPNIGAKIYSLTNPNEKMSKSDNNNNSYILLTDDKDTIINKFKKATTDSESEIKYDVLNKKGISNLLSIFAALKDENVKKIENYFIDKKYSDLKLETAQLVFETLTKIQKKYYNIIKDKLLIKNTLENNAKKIKCQTEKFLNEVKSIVGLV